MEIEVKMAVTVGTTAWEGHKEMFLILTWVLAPQVYTNVKSYSTKYLKFIHFTVYEVRSQNVIDIKKENENLECKWRTEQNKDVLHLEGRYFVQILTMSLILKWNAKLLTLSDTQQYQ